MERRIELESLLKIHGDQKPTICDWPNDRFAQIEALHGLLPGCDVYSSIDGEIFAVVDRRYLIAPWADKEHPDALQHVFDMTQRMESGMINNFFGEPVTWSWFNPQLKTFMLDLEYTSIYPEKSILSPILDTKPRMKM